MKKIKGQKRVKPKKSESRNTVKINIFQKMGFKITMIIALATLLASTICMIIVVPNSIDTVTKTVRNELQSMVNAYSSQVNAKLIDMNVISYDGYSNMLSEMKIAGTESSYAYLVDSQGIMKYHPDIVKVGKSVENSVIKGVVERIKKGERPESAVVEYDYNGETKFAGYQVLSDSSVLVITADKSEILESVNHFTIVGIVGAAAVTIICTIIGLIFVVYTVRPIKRLIHVIDETAVLDFTDETKVRTIAKRGDEVGAMGKAVARMREQLREIVIDIQNISDTIYKDVSRVNDVSAKIREECMDNSATTEELAAGMQETSATTGTITSNIEGMKHGATDIRKLSDDGVQLSSEITERALSLRESTNVATTRTTEMYETIKSQAAKAMEAAECVKQINAMTDSIMQISSQTSLLALNASIEAARAGEAGRGFAVVASEISKLANETSNSVTSIDSIVDQVNSSVAEMVKSMEDTTHFLDEVVLKDYEQFNEVSDQYNNDADVVKKSMKNVETSITSLAESITVIADAINGINATVDESAVGVTDIAEKTSNVVLETSENAELVDACMESVKTLEGIAKKFKI